MSDLVGDVGEQTPPPAPVAGFPPASNAGVRARATELRARRVPFVMATVVRAESPTSAKAGDVAIVYGDGRIEGFVGGECAEASVQLQALRVLEAAQPVLLRIAPEAAPAEGPGDIQQGTVVVHNPCLSGGSLEIFLEPEIPPPLMVVHGESPIARALAGLAAQAGYVLDTATTGGATTDDLVTGAAAVVVASHGREEEAVLTSAVRAGVPYVGLVASRKRGAAVLERLDLPAAAAARIHTPAGLDLGARGPQEIAVSILAEIIASRRQAGGGAARDDAPTAEAAAPSAMAPTAVDPVCGMAVADVAGSLFADHDAKRYLFCGSGCRDAFLADPEGFLARS